MKTLGEYRVGIDFNPGGNESVNRIKRAAAELIDIIDSAAEYANEGEVNRLVALAVTHVENGAMWAVKAVTKPERQM
jgi:hypothetical protein